MTQVVIFGALLTNLSKSFDCLSHGLLPAKLHANGLDMPSLKPLHCCLTKKRQRVKINNIVSGERHFLESHKGLFLAHFCLIFFFCDLFLFVPDIGIANYADGNTPHATNKHLETALKDLEQGADILLKWFTDHHFKANPEKISTYYHK